MAKVRVSIVFEEQTILGYPDGIKFNVFLDLASERAKEIDAMTPEEQLAKLSTAEFWALRCFQICAGVMAQAGAIREATKRGEHG